MAKRAMWKGVVRLGEESLPVKLYAAVEDRNIHFHLLHDQDMQRVRQRMAHSETGETVETQQQQRGVQVEPDTIVVLAEEELTELQPEPSRDIEVGPLLPIGAIHHQWYDRPYYLGPDGNDVEYFALAEALHQTETEGIARWVMRNKEYLGALAEDEGYLMLVTLRHQGEVIDATELEPPEGGKLPEKEQKLARQLISALEEDFLPEEYHDTYREQVAEMVAAKARGEAFEVPAGTSVKEEDSLFHSLEASLQAVGR